MFRQFAAASTAFGVLWIATATSSLADHHEVGQVEAALKKFYSQMSAGKFEAAMSHIAIGGRGYVASGDLTTFESEEFRAGVVQMLEDGAARGATAEFQPSDIKVTAHGGTYLVTFTVDSKQKGPEDDEVTSRTARGSMVWAKTDQGLKILHWHISEPASDDE